MNTNEFIITQEDPCSPVAAALTEELSDCLTRMTGSSGKSSIKAEDFLREGSLFAVAWNTAGNAVGCGGFRPIDEKTAEIKRMYARTSASGIGSKILAFLENSAALKGYTALRLETRRINKNAVRFYHKNGYFEIPNYGIYENRPEAICFEKKL